MFLSRAMGLAAVVCLVGCQSSTPVQFARPKAPSAAAMQQALGGTGYSGTATFNAPIVDPNTWTGSPIGTGSWSAQSTPPQSGGSQSIGADDLSDPSQPVHYIVIGNLSGGPSTFFGIVSLNAFTPGARTVDNVSTFAGIFDGNTGDPIALATSGTVTILSAGATVSGSFNGTLEDYAAPAPQCTSNAQCPSGSTCQGGRCAPSAPQCTSSSQCPPNSTCQGGACVPSAPQCTSNAQCPAGSSCQGGVCVTNPNPGCTSNSQCSSPAVCQNGQCVVPGMCRVDSDCATGQVCAGGTCVTGPVNPPLCDAQGTGAYSGSAGAVATCSALGSALSVTNGMAAIGEDQNGQLALFVVDSAGSSNGLVIPLSACPSGSGTVQVSGAQIYSEVNGGPGLTLFAVRDAAGSVTFTAGAHLTGTISLTLVGGGTVSGTFDVQ
jgi:Cys-rich repeat protein